MNPEPLKHVATHSWLEMPVRPWLAITLLMGVATIIFGSMQLTKTLRERWLILNGTPVSGKVTIIGITDAKVRQATRESEQDVQLTYVDPKSGRTIQSRQFIPRKPGAMVSLDEVLKVRIDPDQPETWTERSEPVPIVLEMGVPMLMAGVVAICLAMTWLRRVAVKKTLTTGRHTQATVVSVRQSPLAPMSKQIGVAVEGPDRTIRHAYWPVRFGPIHKENSIEVAVSDSGMVIPLRAYQSHGLT